MISVVCALLFILVFLYIDVRINYSKLNKKYENFMKGKNAENLHDAIQESFDQMEELKKSTEETENRINQALGNLTSTFHKLGIVKYDAFKEMGGNLSFVVCLLDDNDTGFILNTMHGRNSSYTYIKEIIKGEAYSTLGEEEKEALSKAKNM